MNAVSVPPTPTRSNNQLLHKTKLCWFHLQGKCSRGNDCKYAHHYFDLRKKPNWTKTKLCKQWQRNGVCNDGDTCNFAHGEENLRQHVSPSKDYVTCGNTDQSAKAITMSESKFLPDSIPMFYSDLSTESPEVFQVSKSEDEWDFPDMAKMSRIYPPQSQFLNNLWPFPAAASNGWNSSTLCEERNSDQGKVSAERSLHIWGAPDNNNPLFEETLSTPFGSNVSLACSIRTAPINENRDALFTDQPRKVDLPCFEAQRLQDINEVNTDKRRMKHDVELVNVIQLLMDRVKILGQNNLNLEMTATQQQLEISKLRTQLTSFVKACPLDDEHFASKKGFLPLEFCGKRVDGEIPSMAPRSPVSPNTPSTAPTPTTLFEVSDCQTPFELASI